MSDQAVEILITNAIHVDGRDIKDGGFGSLLGRRILA